ncbi:calcium-binding protein PBP1-like [Malania oleifera]|uniref:calcium-binding protein PBP1-like n=1 Tax=Malania oleifera TaxID=397392 RepID=UPI0025AE3B98|nr:calcium-binding protein PBP1-like [Malania oleifera]
MPELSPVLSFSEISNPSPPPPLFISAHISSPPRSLGSTNRKEKKRKSHLLFCFLRPMASQNVERFEDYLPVMADKLGGDGLIEELCNGFRLLTDGDRELITFDSLKRNAALLGLEGFSDEDLRSMMKEGDSDNDGALSLMEFCVLMFRLSPDLMERSQLWLEEALQQEFQDYYC